MMPGPPATLTLLPDHLHVGRIDGICGFDTMSKAVRHAPHGAGLALISLSALPVRLPPGRKRRRRPVSRLAVAAKRACKGTCTATPGQRACGASCIASDICCTDDVLGCIGGTTCSRRRLPGLLGSGRTLCRRDHPVQLLQRGLQRRGTCSCYTPGQSCSKNRQCCSGWCRAVRARVCPGAALHVPFGLLQEHLRGRNLPITCHLDLCG